MRGIGWLRWLLLVTLLIFPFESGFAQLKKNVEVQVVRYTELNELVAKNRGKVVMVDFWATYCPPCLKELPHLVQMHKKYAAQGLVTITVSLDQIKTDPKVKQKVLQQLQKADAQMINVILDEDFAFIQKKLRFDGPPCVFVFDRKGKWAEFKDDKFRPDLIEQTVVQFLKGK